MSRRRTLRTTTALLAVAATLAACAPGPSPAPPFITGLGDQGAPAASSKAPAPAPAWKAPAADSIAWRDCGDELGRQYGTGAPVGSVTVECASIRVAQDPSATGGDEIEIGLTRASSSTAPKDAAPLVLVGGTTFTSDRALLTLASSDAPLLAERPVVAVERRGLGPDSAVSCLTPSAQATLRTGGAPGAVAARSKEITAASTAAATTCSDKLTDSQTLFTPANAAADLDVLRSTWGVPALGLLSVGDGSTVALAYLAAHPDRVARLVLDSPVRYGGDLRDRVEDAAKGTAATLASFATQCRAVACALGADPTGAVRDVFARAQAGTLGVSDTELLQAVTAALAIGPGPQSARVSKVATALASARAGDDAGLRGLVSDAQAAADSDGQYVSRCSDTGQKPSPDQVSTAAADWERRYPLGGRAAALSMLDCSAWPAVASPPAPRSARVPTVALLPANDPLTSRDAMTGLSGQFLMAGTRLAAVEWSGIGDGAVMRSTCAQQAIAPYLDDLDSPATGACPA
ncbi:alpha/beta hydrolase [Tsukamurella sp. 8F]|uniref:alpha/beta hydrolase n=1 Tax=unclassified Tsukamurella TaxID=2633480 RepID=UPI0023B98C25|nr:MULTISPECIES: alpha/beta hydrolase [unclassified Tsukamurella]MDF0531416.1 alpha/beta hydrolase [Tsukamurella sp. 8J]MDF0585278.1 alpha/beta hydrolase [Tsukamurella sp. 8F]